MPRFTPPDPERISGTRKAAALLVSLGSELAAQVLKSLPEDQVEAITREIVRMDRLPAELREATMQQVYEDAMANQFVTSGGSDFARDLLARTLGTQKAAEVLSRAGGSRREQPFAFLAEIDPAQVILLLEQEHPQTAAVILANMQPELSGRLLAGMAMDAQAEVASRIALMQRISPERIKEIEGVLRRRVATLQQQEGRQAGGVDYLVKVLSGMDSRSERRVLETLEQQDPELAAEVRKQMFTFEDLTRLDDRSLQRVLREVNQNDLTLALRNASPDLQARVFRNMSSRSAQTIRENIDLGPVRLRVIEEAQQKIIDLIRRLQEAEEIVVGRGDEDVLI